MVDSADEFSAKNLKDLVTKRSSIKGQITKFKNYLDKITKQEHLSSIEVTELTLKLTKFEGLAQKFDDIQTQIEVINSEKIDIEIDERSRIDEEIIFTIATAKTFLDDFNHEQEIQRRESMVNDSQSSAYHQKELGFKLPKIEIAKFNGDYFHWLEFRDTFLTLIHHNDRLSSIQKFHYLTSYLTSDAARIISNLEVSCANYNEAWRLICSRYDNKRLLINHHLKAIHDVKPITLENERDLRYLVDHVTKNLRALSSLGQPTDKWDTLIIFALLSKLDNNTLMKWEESRNDQEDFPSLIQFNKFLVNRADVLEALHRNKSKTQQKETTFHKETINKNKQLYNNSRFQNTKSFATTTQNKTNIFLCIVCNENHRIYDCPVFKSKNIDERLAEVAKYKLCSNCLRQGHPTNDCRMGPCRIGECKQRHNSLLHKSSTTANTSSYAVSEESNQLSLCSVQTINQVLLSTAMIQVTNPKTNECIQVRALLDSGSQSSFISRSLKTKLSLKSSPVNIDVIGIGNNNKNKVLECCTAQLKSILSPFNMLVNCFVLEQLTGEFQKSPINRTQLKIPSHINLADPTFDKPAPIDVLIGADCFWDIIGDERKSLGPDKPKLHSSQFGWLLAGPINNTKVKAINANHAIVSPANEKSNITDMLTKFWELEDIPHKISSKDNECEKHFNENTIRMNTGRFCVKLPLKDTPDCLGSSYHIAKKRLLNLEKRFRKNPDLKTKYTKFINEYAELGHLTKTDLQGYPDTPHYYLCHHAVFKENSESSQIRVVFHGSLPSTSGVSVNDLMQVGPNVQDSLFSILIRARQYKYLLTGDIEKMYRQVDVNKEDRNLQLILWREDESKPINTLQLNTLTYGTASASYLSTRCLLRVGEDCKDPLIGTIIQRDFYVDDLITGADDETELRFMRKAISEALKSYCFKLRKFKSNSMTVLDDLNINEQDNLTLSESSSTLGLGWIPKNDVLHFPVKIPPLNSQITKRFIMSNSFKIFDPLGLLSPSTIQPKIMLQLLWKAEVDWDESVNEDISKMWLEFASNLHEISSLQIPRHVICDNATVIEMHCFSDASIKAYGACIYMRTLNSANQVSVRLLSAKSKVAPVKPTTVPRLELCAALLSARLSKSIIDSLRYKPTRTIYWCDSSIVLGWLKSDTSKLKTFVANRIGEIVELTLDSTWRYVPTKENPADLVSRGVNPSQLTDLESWWLGPNYLRSDPSQWPTLHPHLEDLPEVKINAFVSIITTDVFNVINIEKYSNLTHLKRTTAYLLRFLNNLKSSKKKLSGFLNTDELNNAFHFLCAAAQRQSFPKEYKQLMSNKPISGKSNMLSLSPFIDNGVIRAGGRIEASCYSYGKKHPIILDSSHYLTKLAFETEHLKQLHAGPQLLLSIVRDTIWPIHGRKLARRTVRNCVRCRRVEGKILNPKMGNLPPQRLNPDFPFLSVGIDFAGPFHIVNRKGRGARLIKCYMCLFVCLRYKCIHIEAVSDLSMDSFLMTFKKYISRRGKPVEVFCDNGTNFVAASKEINSLFKNNNQPLFDFACQEGIKFKFSPPYAPHFGGIWEAGVKSAKFHIKRVMGNAHLSFEEISTLFAQVEAILNSRPLCPLSSSPDLLSLTPGHFLIGRPLVALPTPDLEECNENRLRRYARLEQIRQHFWRRWQGEYISELQKRKKWKTDKAQLNIGDLAILQEDHSPPLCWRLGRVTQLFPGPDGISRVAELNTTRGLVRRALVRLCPLPREDEEDV